MFDLRTILVLFITLFSGLMSAHANERAPSDEQLAASWGTGTEIPAVHLYQEGVQFLFLGEIESAESRLLASIERDPAFVPARRSLCAMNVSRSARQALPHCQAWAKHETNRTALDYARKIVSRLENSVADLFPKTS